MNLMGTYPAISFLFFVSRRRQQQHQITIPCKVSSELKNIKRMPKLLWVNKDFQEEQTIICIYVSRMHTD